MIHVWRDVLTHTNMVRVMASKTAANMVIMTCLPVRSAMAPAISDAARPIEMRRAFAIPAFVASKPSGTASVICPKSMSGKAYKAGETDSKVLSLS